MYVWKRKFRRRSSENRQPASTVMYTSTIEVSTEYSYLYLFFMHHFNCWYLLCSRTVHLPMDQIHKSFKTSLQKVSGAFKDKKALCWEPMKKKYICDIVIPTYTIKLPILSDTSRTYLKPRVCESVLIVLMFGNM